MSMQMIHDGTNLKITMRWAQNKDTEPPYPVVDIEFDRLIPDHNDLSGRSVTTSEMITLFLHKSDEGQLVFKDVHGFKPTYTRTAGNPQDMVLTLKKPDLFDGRLPDEEKELIN